MARGWLSVKLYASYSTDNTPFQKPYVMKIEFSTVGVSKLITRRPNLFGFSVIALSILFSAIAFAVYPFEIDSSGATFVPSSSTIYRRQTTLLLAEERTRFNPFRAPDDDSGINVPLQSSTELSLTVIFKANGNIFSPERVRVMKALEDEIISIGGYQDVCTKDRDSAVAQECLFPTSTLPYFYAAPVSGCPGVYNQDIHATDITQSTDAVLLGLIDPNTEGRFCQTTSANCSKDCKEPSQSDWGPFVSKGFGYPGGDVSLTPELSSDVTRTIFNFGMPLPGYLSPTDRYTDQEKIINNFIRQTRKVIESYDGREGVSTYWLAEILLDDYFLDIIFRDTLLIVVSIFMVWIYMTFHLQSLYLSSLGMLHIILAFPIAYLFTQASMDFGGMSVLQLMSLFIILGIGADDVFIFVDTWKQSAIEVPRPTGLTYPETREDHQTELCKDWLLDRMQWTYSRAASAMLITSLTTGAAFVMNISSAVPAIQIFGGFTAFMVLFNYLLVITWYPCVMIWYQVRGQYWKSPLSFCVAPYTAPEDVPQQKIESLTPDKPAEHERDVSKYRALERWFYSVYGPALIKGRWFILGAFAIYFFLSLGFATQLSGSDSPAQWLPDDNPIQETFDILDNGFQQDENVPQIIVFFGLHLVDNRGVNPYDPNEVGKTSYDYHVQFSREDAQQRFVELCTIFRDQPFVLDREVLCPMEEFRDWIVGNGGTFPVPQASFVNSLADYTKYIEEEEGPAPDYSGTTAATEQDASSRESRASTMNEIYQTIRFDLHEDKVLRYMAIVINTTVPAFASASRIEPMYDHFEGLIDNLNSQPASRDVTLGNGIQTSALYVAMELEQTLLVAAVNGIAASISLSFVVILVLTRDFVLSTFSIISIGGVVTSLIAMIVWMGWELTLVESICMTILVGLSVDYVIHMANAYRESDSSTRFLRVRDALATMGISVVSASITSILSAFVLVFTTIVFFFKFGLFIMLTIIFSTLWAFGFFMALMAVAGRTERHDDFKWIYDKVREKWCPVTEISGSAVEGVDPEAQQTRVTRFDSDGQFTEVSASEGERRRNTSVQIDNI